jgi:polyvinyl alcohol dehydrogenase (cytochrome)
LARSRTTTAASSCPCRVNEEVQGGRPEYECCTFRGSLSSLDADTGNSVWKTYTIAEKQTRGKNAAGTPLWGPAGGGIWSSPTIDAERGSVYVSTGNGYADPPQPLTDAVIALDLSTGRVRWSRQFTANDNWTLGCGRTNETNPNCPGTLGPDFDFAASPALVTVDGRDLLVLPQKSGMLYALDADRQGEPVWEYRFGRGSGRGGQWGSAVDGRNAYVGVTDFTAGGIVAVDLATGRRVWERPGEPLLCGVLTRACSPAQGAAVTAIPGAVLSGSLDGGLRAYSAETGELLWQFDTNRAFTTVNGVAATGGSMDAAGPTVAAGLLIVNSGYGGISSMPGNVLLVFGVE